MIVAERKPLKEIISYTKGCKKILVLGCGTCVAVCMAGGEKEVQILASQIRLYFLKKGENIKVDEETIQRQCDVEFFDIVKGKVKDYDIIISMACGAGVQMASDILMGKAVIPALNTTFIGVTDREGEWSEKCRACSNCLIGETGGICPITICPKSLVNGPCGGTNHGKCEVDKDKDCAWTLIYQRLESLGRLDNIRRIHGAKNYQTQTTPAKIIHYAYNQEEV